MKRNVKKKSGKHKRVPSPAQSHARVVKKLSKENHLLRLEVAVLKEKLVKVSQPGVRAEMLEKGGTEVRVAPAMQKKVDALAPRQREALKLLLTGETERTISVRMAISAHTLHDYVKQLYSAMGATSRATLIARCLKSSRR